MKSWLLALMASGVVLGACSTTYHTAVVNEKTGLYDTRTVVDPGGVTVSKTAVNLDDFGAVVLIAGTNRYPARLEFVARRTLNELGFRNVVNLAEFRQWAADSKFELPADVTGDTVKSFSARVKPVLIVDVAYGASGSPHAFAGLRVIDGRTSTPLLLVSHPKTVWIDVDDEVIYPVLNELRKWHHAVLAQKTTKAST